MNEPKVLQKARPQQNQVHGAECAWGGINEPTKGMDGSKTGRVFGPFYIKDRKLGKFNKKLADIQ